MLRSTKRQFPTWQQALLIVIAGVAIGYPSAECVGHAIWGGSEPHPGLCLLGFVGGAVIFVSGFGCFLAIAIIAFTSSPAEPGITITGHLHASSAGVSSEAPQGRSPAVFVKRRATLPRYATVAHVCLRIVLIVVIALVAYGRWPLGGRSHYDRFNWQIAWSLNQLPYVVAFIRTVKTPHRAGLALATVTGVAQVLATMPLAIFQYQVPDFIPAWLAISLGLAIVVFACLTWWPTFNLKDDSGLVVSICFSFLAYTVLALIASAIIERLWHR